MSQRRQISRDQRKWLGEQLELWREEGLADDDLSSKILDLYETEEHVADRKGPGSCSHSSRLPCS